jgi:formylglycine-generating enzyme required for sulfatase activity
MVNEYIEAKTNATGKFFRLPSEPRWEYACKAGSTAIFSFGDDIEQLSEHAWYGQSLDQLPAVHPVGVKQPNAWGLHDMHGNAAEFCDGAYDATGKLIDVEDKAAQPATVSVRGGSAATQPTYVRSSQRIMTGADSRAMDLGFRIILPPQ